jgi:UDP-N-acetylglucosamine--N-acetylmuramyl-(pentapeptide) pyrophosphoryl-undecaprenol N-acetylglucosamine transferase
MSGKKNIKILISGGGTGGHIFPAIAIAKAIERAIPESQFLFVGAKDKMEMQKVPEAGYTIEGLWISGFNRSLTLKNLSFPFKLISSLWKARKIVKKFKPDVAVGVGGFASGPTLNMAASLEVPCVIQEQNSYPGVTNKLLARKVKKICVAYEGMEQYFPKEKIVLTGNPIRSQVIDIENKKEEAQEFFNLDNNKKTVLIVGGSLGAQSVNRAVIAHLSKWSSSDFQLVWQTGKTTYENSKTALEQSGATNIHIHEFISRMDLAYAASDLIVSRAGAIAISEISAIGKPVVFIPFPYAAEDHQTKNAQKLVSAQAAQLIKDSDVKEELFPVVEQLIHEDKLLQKMGNAIKEMGITDADDKIAKEVISLIK